MNKEWQAATNLMAALIAHHTEVARLLIEAGAKEGLHKGQGAAGPARFRAATILSRTGLIEIQRKI